jgi:hypothetical protein
MTTRPAVAEARSYPSSREATRVTSAPAKSRELRQRFLVVSANSENRSRVSPGTAAVQCSTISVIFGPLSSPRCTSAVVSMRIGTRASSLISAERTVVMAEPETKFQWPIGAFGRDLLREEDARRLSTNDWADTACWSAISVWER